MANDSWIPYGAAAGGLAIALYLVGALIAGTPPDFDAPAREVAAYLAEDRTRIQLGSAIQAVWAPLFVYFLATVVSLASTDGAGAHRAALVALGCGLMFITLFLADVTALAVAALRPENMAAHPELATALHDFSWLAMATAAPLAVGMLAAFASLALRHEALWPRWLGRLALLAGLAYTPRLATLFTTDGPFAADGLLGLWLPVAALAAWLFTASVVLTLTLRRPD